MNIYRKHSQKANSGDINLKVKICIVFKIKYTNKIVLLVTCYNA